MRAFGIWGLTVIMVYAIGFAVADDFGRILGLFYMIGSGTAYGIYRLIKRKQVKEIKTPIQ